MIVWADVVLGARQWLGAAVALALVALGAVVWSYVTARAATWVRATSALLKAVGIVALSLCLVEPLYTGTRPRPGSNLFLVVADNSRSLRVGNEGQSRGQAMLEQLTDTAPWLVRLAQDFDVRRYAFDSAVRPVTQFSQLEVDGQSSTLSGTLATLADRYREQPVAGVLLLTDGNATDWDMAADSRASGARALDVKRLPPVYPVVLGDDSEQVDVSVTRLSVTQTNFEAAPVTLTAEVAGRAVAGRKVILRVLDEAGKEVERREITKLGDTETVAERFLVKPERRGVSFYTVQASLAGEEEATEAAGNSREATLANNRRLATVDRGGGPYRVLYVSGRPNWEYKFLRRAVNDDDEVQLVGLVRIARREPKFSFLGRSGERTNPLFRGFGNQGDEQAEQYDQPVLLRFGTEDGDELRGGFPKDAEDLYRYHAVVLDDVEAAFFTQDQLSLLQQFVSRRGGGLLMLGGKESFAHGGYDRSPVGEMLPVYLDRMSGVADDQSFRLKITREGWLQPWLRLRPNETDEQQRLAGMPAFQTVNLSRSIKPGATVLAHVEGEDGTEFPALVTQPFGRGRASALMIGDLWRWNLKRADAKESDLEKSWRQTIRWLVADVPKPVEAEVRRANGGSLPGAQVIVRARDKQFEPLDNAVVSLHVTTPDGREVELAADSSERSPGQYEATFTPRVPGAYRARVSVTGPDGSDVGSRDIGWAVEPDTDEFSRLSANRPLLERLASDTGGEMVELRRLDRFVGSLPNRKIPITESWTYPIWHQWSLFMLAVICLVGEWGLRRWKGMP